MPAIGAALVADILLQQIEVSAPGRLGLLADCLTKRFNAELRANAPEFDVKTPAFGTTSRPLRASLPRHRYAGSVETKKPKLKPTAPHLRQQKYPSC